MATPKLKSSNKDINYDLLKLLENTSGVIKKNNVQDFSNKFMNVQNQGEKGENDNGMENLHKLLGNGHLLDGNTLISNPKRDLARKQIADKLTDTTPNKHNGVKLLVLLVIVVIIILSCVYLSKKLRQYLQNEGPTMIYGQRKGRLGLYLEHNYNRFEDSTSDTNTLPSRETK